jgi:hypothetical protein
VKGKTPGVGARFRPHGPYQKGAVFLESHEARVGTLVRLLDGGKRDGKGLVGTIERTYGHPDYLAMEVRFEDGGAELCWHHELTTEGSAPPYPQSAYYDGG